MRIALLVLLSATLSAQQIDTGPGKAAADAYNKSKLLELEKERLEMERQLSQQRLEVEQQRLEIERKRSPGTVGLQAQTVRAWPKMDLLAKTTYLAGFEAGFQWAASLNSQQHPVQTTVVEAMARCLGQIGVRDLSNAIDNIMNEIQEEDRDAPLWGAVSVASIKICKVNGSL